MRLAPGSYPAKYLAINKGGTAAAPVTVTGMDGQDRPVLKLSGTDMGAYCVQLQDGADHLRWTGVNVASCGLAAWKITGSIVDLTIDHVDATDTRGLVYMATPQNSTIPEPALDGFDFHDINVAKCSRGQFGMRNARNGTITDVTMDSQMVNGDPITVLSSFDGDSYHVRHLRCFGRNAFDDRGGDPNKYWNGDIFSTEGSTRDIWYTDCGGSVAVDAIFDLKGGTDTEPHRIRNGTATRAKRPLRIGNTGGSVTHVDVDGLYLGTPEFVPNPDTGLQQNPSPGGRAYVWIQAGSYLSYRAGSIITPDGMITSDKIVFNDGSSSVTTY